MLKNGNREWQAWVLNISIAIISTLILMGIGNLSLQLVEIKAEIKNVVTVNHAQDLCLQEIKIRQDERLFREGKIQPRK